MPKVSLSSQEPCSDSAFFHREIRIYFDFCGLGCHKLEQPISRHANNYC